MSHRANRDKMLGHVIGAESAYARKLGVRLDEPVVGDVAAIRAFRAAMVAACRERAALGEPGDDAKALWPVRYFIRRLTWHALDHAWEMQDRSLPA